MNLGTQIPHFGSLRLSGVHSSRTSWAPNVPFTIKSTPNQSILRAKTRHMTVKPLGWFIPVFQAIRSLSSAAWDAGLANDRSLAGFLFLSCKIEMINTSQIGMITGSLSNHSKRRLSISISIFSQQSQIWYFLRHTLEQLLQNTTFFWNPQFARPEIAFMPNLCPWSVLSAEDFPFSPCLIRVWRLSSSTYRPPRSYTHNRVPRSVSVHSYGL